MPELAKRFEDLRVWKLSTDLTEDVYLIFRSNRDFGFRDQIQRASVSIMNNIAEGFERQSPNEFKHFLNIAKGSAGEVRSLSHLACRLGYITPAKEQQWRGQLFQLSRMLTKLHQSLP